MKHNGCIHLYHGNGKGKTTCAMGLALRFSHYGGNVLVVQCLKDGSSGEISQLNQFSNIKILAKKVSDHFTWEMTPEEKDATKTLLQDFLKESIQSNWDLLVVDEICAALTHDFLEESQVMELLASRKPHQEIVFTGRNPPPFLLEAAHYVTHFQEEKHPYALGIPAREGIEF